MGNVPHAVERFVGRVDKLDELHQKLSETRLVDITGVGGGGKTRLALEFAARMQDSGEFEDGVWIAELDSVNDENDLFQAVLTAVDAPGHSTRTPLKTLLEYLRDKSMLLVLDNCEHLGRTVGKLAITLLRATKDLRIIATSRTQLGVAGEAVVSVHPMTVPPEDAPLPAVPYEYEAVQLFHAFVNASVSGWEFTEENWPYVVQILRGVDGIPLAIRLVAVRLRTMGIKDLVARMGDLFALLNKNDLAADQHETLEAVFRWNLTNCSEAERVLWARASVFAGTFTLEAAEQVCSDDALRLDQATGIDEQAPFDRKLLRSQIADALRGLVEASTVEYLADSTRYRLLVPLRQFGATLLAERGEQDALLNKRRDYYCCLGAHAARHWYGKGEYDLLSELAADLPNFAAVMHSYIAAPDPQQTGYRLAVNLVSTRLFFYLGRMREAIAWLDRTRDATPNPDPGLEIAARSLDLFVDFCIGADMERVQHRLKRLQQIAADLGQTPPGLWFVEGVERLLLHNDRSRLPLLDQAYTALRAAGPDMYGNAAMTLLLKAIGETLIGDKHHANAAADRILDETRIAESPWMIRWAEWCAAVVVVRFGQPTDAAIMLEDLLRAQTNKEADNWLPMWIIEVMAWTAARMRAGQRTAFLLGIAAALNRITGTRLEKILPFREGHLKAEATAKQLLGDAGYRAAFAQGAQVHNFAEARRVALEASVPGLDLKASHGVVDDSHGSWDQLTTAQQEVALLVLQGLKNKEIARLRRSSERTIETHVAAIREKAGIGTASRVAIAAWVSNSAPKALLASLTMTRPATT